MGSPRGGASTVGPVDGDVELKCRSPLQTLWSRQRLEVGAAQAGGVSSFRPPAGEQNPPSLRAPSRSADFGDCPLGTKLRPGTRNVRSQLPLPRKVELFPTPCAPCRAPLTVLPARWSRRRAPRTVLPDSVLPVSVLPTPCSPIPCSVSVLPAPRGPSLHVVRGDRLSFVLTIGFIVLIDLNEPDFGFVGLPWSKVTNLCFPVPVFILPLSCLRCSEFAVVLRPRPPSVT